MEVLVGGGRGSWALWAECFPLGVGAPPRKGNRIKVGGDNTEYMGTCWSSVLH